MKRLFAFVGALFFLSVAAAQAVEYQGVVSYRFASDSREVSFSSPQHSWDVYPAGGTASACGQQGNRYGKLLETVLGDSNGFVRIRYASCGENLATVCVDRNETASTFTPQVCVLVSTVYPEGVPAPERDEFLRTVAEYSISGGGVSFEGDAFVRVENDATANRACGGVPFANFRRKLNEDTNGKVFLEVKSCGEKFASVCINPDENNSSGLTCIGTKSINEEEGEH